MASGGRIKIPNPSLGSHSGEEPHLERARYAGMVQTTPAKSSIGLQFLEW